MLAKVFSPHPALARGNDGAVRPKFPLEPLEKFGELISLLGNSELARHAVLARQVIRDRLVECEYDPRRDYFVIQGDATVICLMVEVSIAAFGAAPRYLRWNRTAAGFDVCGGGHKFGEAT